jgi:hypothetical protein
MFKSKRRLILFQEHSKSEYFHNVQMSSVLHQEYINCALFKLSLHDLVSFDIEK